MGLHSENELVFERPVSGTWLSLHHFMCNTSNGDVEHSDRPGKCPHSLWRGHSSRLQSSPIHAGFVGQMQDSASFSMFARGIKRQIGKMRPQRHRRDCLCWQISRVVWCSLAVAHQNGAERLKCKTRHSINHIRLRLLFVTCSPLGRIWQTPAAPF